MICLNWTGATFIKKKLLLFQTPRIVEATTERSKVFDLPAAGELVKEGYLLSKTAVADGKKASDRSWKPYWILLRGHCLYLFKDKAAANTVRILWFICLPFVVQWIK